MTAVMARPDIFILNIPFIRFICIISGVKTLWILQGKRAVEEIAVEEIQEYGENALLDDYPRKELVFFNEHYRFYPESTHFTGVKAISDLLRLDQLSFYHINETAWPGTFEDIHSAWKLSAASGKLRDSLSPEPWPGFRLNAE